MGLLLVSQACQLMTIGQQAHLQRHSELVNTRPGIYSQSWEDCLTFPPISFTDCVTRFDSIFSSFLYISIDWSSVHSQFLHFGGVLEFKRFTWSSYCKSFSLRKMRRNNVNGMRDEATLREPAVTCSIQTFLHLPQSQDKMGNKSRFFLLEHKKQLFLIKHHRAYWHIWIWKIAI